MATTRKALDHFNTGSRPLLPDDLRKALAIIPGRLLGLVLFLAGAAMLLGLTSYDSRDPSWNTAAPGAAANWMGPPGAALADVLLQFLGFGAYTLALALGIWGGRKLIRGEGLLNGIRAACFGGGFFLVLAALGAVPVPETGSDPVMWPPTAALGGVAGPVLLNTLSWPMSLIFGSYGTLATAFVAGVGGTVLISRGLTVPWSFWLRVWSFVCRSLGAVGRGIWQVLLWAVPSFARGLARFWGQLPFWRLARIGQSLRSGPKPEPRKRPQRRTAAARPRNSGTNAEKPSAPAPEPQERTAPPAQKKPPARSARQSSLPLGESRDGWILPPPELLQAPPEKQIQARPDQAALQANAEMLAQVLKDFNVRGEIVNIRPGPVVTLYELEPAPGTKSARVIGLADDIARSMAAVSVRVAVVPGRNVIGIELPNQKRETVYFRENLESQEFEKSKAALPLALGKDIGGTGVIADLARMPHLLVAGTTGSGKSVAINTMIGSLLARLTPEQCRMIMIDPKMLELSVYDDIPHLLTPVVTEPNKAVMALKWAVQEMEERYRAMSTLGVRNIEGYNARINKARDKGEVLTRKVQTGYDPETGKPQFEDQPLDMTPLPYIVIVVDEFADLMLVAGKDVENAIQRLAQMARAAGIHLIMATQRPSVDVITGVIKANFPTRISFQVTSKIDSRTILGEGGAEQLLGQGDMLYMAGGGRIKRVHGAFVSDQEVEDVVGHLKSQGSPDYKDEITEDGTEGSDSDVLQALFGDGSSSSEEDQLYDRAVSIVAKEGKASTSFIQRHLQIGYNRAARIMERMEQEGVVSKASATGKREILTGSH